MAGPIDEGFTTHVEDLDAIYRRALAKAEEYKRAAVAPNEPNPVSGGPDTPGHAAPGRMPGR